MVDDPLTQAGIDRKYSGDADKNIYVSDLHPTDMSPEWTYDDLSDDAKRMIHCVLHFRRIETLHDGLRWLDIKRYGITVHHAYREPKEDEIHHDYLFWNDPRRIVQIPYNAIDAGYPSTDRTMPANNNNNQSWKSYSVAQ